MHAPDSSPAYKSFRLAPHWRFLLVAGGLYLLWLIAYEGFIGPDIRFDAWLASGIATSSASLLRVVGFDTVASSPPPMLSMDGVPAVTIGSPCNGLVLYALFTGFLLAFPGPWRPKLWGIPAGIAVIFALNVVRVAALALNHHYAHRSVDFNHHYTFTFIVYACIGAMWVWWARHYGPAETGEA